MVNLRSRPKTRVVALRTASKMEPMIPAPSPVSDQPDLSEAALRKLPRSKLQKLAMAHKVKANLKSEIIIRQLSCLHRLEKTELTDDEHHEGPSRKKLKRGSVREKDTILPEDQATSGSDAHPNQDMPSAQGPQVPEASPSAPRSTSPSQKAPTKVTYDKELFSGTESEMTEEEQLDYATPVSSRAETPPAANVNDLKRCVTIMREISEQDIALLKKVAVVREAAAALRKKARGIRDLVKSESGRRERMETYFRYWQETEPSWDRQWLYGEKALEQGDANE